MINIETPFVSPGETIVCFGDSITAADPGYVSFLQQKLPEYKFINSGKPGDKTPWALTRFMEDVAAHKPDALLLYFGANDAVIGRGRWADEPMVTPETFRCNLVWMVHLAKQNGVKKFSIATQLGYEGATLAEHGKVYEDYMLAARQAANETGSRIVPFDILFHNEHLAHPENTGLLLTCDGTHPTIATYEKMADTVIAAWKIKQ